FTANDGTDGVQLWKSDGTAAGTVMVTAINPNGDSNPAYLTNVNGTLFFSANDGTDGVQLWKSDGTTTGTVMVTNVNSGGGGLKPVNLTTVGGTLYFTADDGTHGRELWKSNGTAAGTVLARDINPGSAGSSPANLTSVNGVLFLSANDGTHGNQLWVVAPTARFDVSASSSIVGGVSGSLTVPAREPLGNVDAWYGGPVHFTSSDGQAVLPADYTFTATDAGTHTFSGGVTLKTAGSQTVTATDTA